LQLVKKFPAFHGTRRFITALTSVRHLSLSWASPIQSLYPHPTSWRSILILSTHLRLGLPSGLLPSGFPSKILYTPLSRLYILFWPKLLRCLLAAGVAHRFNLLYSGSSFIRFPGYTQRRTTVGRTSLDEWPARHRDLYLTIHITLTTDKRPCPRWDSNPRSQQTNGRRPTP